MNKRSAQEKGFKAKGESKDRVGDRRRLAAPLGIKRGPEDGCGSEDEKSVSDPTRKAENKERC